MGVDSLRVSLESYLRKYEITQRRETTHTHTVQGSHRVGTGTNRKIF